MKYLWRNVPVTKCSCDKMSLWRNVLWRNIRVTKSPCDEMSCDKMSCDEKSMWRNVHVTKSLCDKMSWDKISLWQNVCDEITCDKTSCDKMSAARKSPPGNLFSFSSIQHYSRSSSMFLVFGKIGVKSLWNTGFGIDSQFCGRCTNLDCPLAIPKKLEEYG